MPILDSNTYDAGMDWARHKRCVYLATAAGERGGVKFFPHRGEGMRDTANWLRAQSGNHVVTAATEVPPGPVVTSLQHYGVAVPLVNPAQLHHSCQPRSCPVRRTTCETQGLRPQPPELDEVTALRISTQARELLMKDHNILIARLRDQLWSCFPALAEADSSLHAAWFLDLCTVAPTPADAIGLTAGSLEARLPERTPPSGSSHAGGAAAGASRAVPRTCSGATERQHVGHRAAAMRHPQPISNSATIMCKRPRYRCCETMFHAERLAIASDLSTTDKLRPRLPF